MNKPNCRLRPNNWTVLHTARRYRFVNIELLLRWIFPAMKRRLLEKMLARLYAAGYLCRHHSPVDHRSVYYTPGPRAVKVLGLGRSATRELRPLALYKAYAAMLFCLSAPAGTRIRPTGAELHATFHPEVEAAGQLDAAYFILREEVGEPKLGLLYTDFGGEARRKLLSIRENLADLWEVPAWKGRLLAREAVVGIVTGHEEKKAAYERLLEKHPFPLPVLVQSFPELEPFIGVSHAR